MFKRILAAAIIIIIAFAYVQWGMHLIYAYAWEKTAPDRESLVTDIANMQKVINQPVAVDESLVQKLKDLQAQVDKENALFPASVNITDVVEDLLKLAKNNDIDIIPLRDGQWATALGSGYKNYQIQLIITGDIDHIMTFINQVEGTMLNSLKIDSLDLNGKAMGAATSDNVTGAVEGYITITIYTRT